MTNLRIRADQEIAARDLLVDAAQECGRSSGCPSRVPGPLRVVTPSRHTVGVDVAELRTRAKAEAADLGPVPANAREHELWVEERRGAVVLLAALADHDRQLLRSAANGEWVSITARDLMLAAVAECAG